MPEPIITFFSSVAGSALLTALLLYLTRTWLAERLKRSIQHEYAQQLEAYKAQLKSEHDTTLERLRADLQIAASERHTRFTWLHERMTETIAETYARLYRVQTTISGCMMQLTPLGTGSLEEQLKDLGEAVTNLQDYYFPRRIYLSPQAAAGIDGFLGTLLMTVPELVGYALKPVDREFSIKTWRDYHEQIPPLQRLLEDNLRNLIGVKEEPQQHDFPSPHSAEG